MECVLKALHSSVMDWLFIRYLFLICVYSWCICVLRSYLAILVFWIFVLTGCSGFHADTNVFIDTSCAIARSFPAVFMLVVG